MPDAVAILVGSRRGADGPTFQVLRRWPSRAKVPATLLAMARLALVTGQPSTREFRPVNQPEAIRIVAMPMGRRSKPGIDLAMAMVADARASDGRPGEWSEPRPNEPPPDVVDDDPDDPLAVANHAETALNLLGLLNGQKHFADAAFVFVDRLAHLTGAQRAGIGFLSRSSTRVHALSGAAGANREAAMLRDLGLAMDEAIEQVSTVVYPAEPGGPRITLAHGRYAMRYGAPVLCTIPILLAHDGDRSLIGAVSLEFGQSRHLDARAIRFAEHAAALLGPNLYNLRHLDSTPTARVRRSLPGNRLTLLSQQPRRVLIACGLAGALLAAGLLIPVTDRITAPGRIEGEVQRQLGAPIQGFIGAVHARPGDQVKSGTVLIELDTREIDLEKLKWTARLAELEKRYGEALAGEAQTEVAIARHELSQAQAQLDIIDQKLDRMQIRAPFDGEIISGDLTRSLGAPVQRGEPLVTIAPAGRYRVMIEIDERDIGRIAVGQSGRLVTTDASGEAMPLEISRITPIANSDPLGTRFDVEARLTGDAGDIRSGLNGFAKVDVASRPVLVQTTERLRQWLRVALWRWQL